MTNNILMFYVFELCYDGKISTSTRILYPNPLQSQALYSLGHDLTALLQGITCSWDENVPANLPFSFSSSSAKFWFCSPSNPASFLSSKAWDNSCSNAATCCWYCWRSESLNLCNSDRWTSNSCFWSFNCSSSDAKTCTNRTFKLIHFQGGNYVENTLLSLVDSSQKELGVQEYKTENHKVIFLKKR